MPMYVRRTQSVQLNELTDRIAGKLAEHAGSRQIDLRNVRLAIADASGFTITGFPGDQPGSFYIVLGPETAAAECFSAVRSAITAAENPAG